MNIIYHCFGGAHSSVTAAAIHLGWLAISKVPTYEELMEIPYFEVQIGADHGIFRYMGEDEHHNKIYIIGRRNLRNNFEKLINGLARVYGFKEEFLTVNTMPLVNWKMVIGGYISRGLETPRLGRALVVKGVQNAFFEYVNLVRTVKDNYVYDYTSKKNFRSVFS